jgi:hypothetical protein
MTSLKQIPSRQFARENSSYPDQASRRRNISKEPGFNGGQSFGLRRLVSREVGLELLGEALACG